MHGLIRKWKGLLKCIGPIFFIYLLIEVVDPKASANILKGIRPEVALISVLLFPVLISALTTRWWLICQWLEMEIPFKQLFQIYYISLFLGLMPVIGVSQMSKFVYLKAEEKSGGTIAASIIFDKVFDAMGHLLFGLFALFYFPKIFFQDEYLWLFIVIILLGVVAILIYWKPLWEKLTGFLKNFTNKRIQKIGESLEIDLSKSWSGYNLRFFMFIFGTSIVIGILRALVLFLLALALNINLSFVFVIACRALIGIVSVIPITINGLGTRDAILLLTLPLANYSKEAAIALSILTFLWLLCFKFSGIVFWLKRPLPSISSPKKQTDAATIYKSPK
ncbi:MAG: lysylphosphatidylglycerol synthase transmembrane domain-containing protein [Desulfobacterales bacterium]|jgi:uncharacterized protein (TIRG00374 family)